MKPTLKTLIFTLFAVAVIPVSAQNKYSMNNYRDMSDAKVWKIYADYLSQTRSLLDQGKYAEAMERYRQMVTAPDGEMLDMANRACYAAHTGIAYCYLKMEQFDKAVAHKNKYARVYLYGHKWKYRSTHPEEETLRFALGENAENIELVMSYYSLLELFKDRCACPELYDENRYSKYDEGYSKFAFITSYPEDKQDAVAAIFYYTGANVYWRQRDLMKKKISEGVKYFTEYSKGRCSGTSSEQADAAWIRLEALGHTDPREIFSDYQDIMPLVCYFEASHILTAKDKERYPNALSYLDTHARLLPDMAKKDQVKLTKARLLYEMGYYKDALDLFVTTKTATNEEIVNAKNAHLRKLAEWGLSENEATARNGSGSWRSLYDSQNRYSEQQRAAIAEQRKIADMHRRAEDASLAIELKNKVMPFVVNENWEEADRVAAEGLRQLYGGDAYLYYVRARAFYQRHFPNFANEEGDVTALYRAYRPEASQLIDLCSKSIRCDGSGTNEAYFYRGIAHVILGQANDAAADFNRHMSETVLMRGICYYNTGTAYQNKEWYKDAIEQYKQAQRYFNDQSMKEKCIRRIEECQNKIDKKNN